MAEAEKFEGKMSEGAVAKSRGRRGRRFTVCAAPVEMDESWTPPVIEKTAEEKARIMDQLQRNVLFQGQDEKTLMIIVDAFDKKPFEAVRVVHSIRNSINKA
jgi:hypothetical protein